MLNAGKDRASANSSTLNSSQLKWVCANAETLPFPDNAFDLYTIAFGIRNCTNIDKVHRRCHPIPLLLNSLQGLQVLSEAQRVLKPGGQFACLEFSHVDFPPLRMLYDLYSFQVIPVMGQIVAGDFKSYKYLVESIRQFPNQVGSRGLALTVALFIHGRFRKLSPKRLGLRAFRTSHTRI